MKPFKTASSAVVVLAFAMLLGTGSAVAQSTQTIQCTDTETGERGYYRVGQRLLLVRNREGSWSNNLCDFPAVSCEWKGGEFYAEGDFFTFWYNSGAVEFEEFDDDSFFGGRCVPFQGEPPRW